MSGVELAVDAIHHAVDTIRRLRVAFDAVEERLAAVTDQRDRYMRAINRLDAAITHHERDSFVDVADDALYDARRKVMRDLGEGKR